MHYRQITIVHIFFRREQQISTNINKIDYQATRKTKLCVQNMILFSIFIDRFIFRLLQTLPT